MKQRVKKLLLKDFLETRELDSCVHHGLEMALENVMDENIGASALYHLDNLCNDVFQSIPKVTDERTLFRFTGLIAAGEKNGEKWDGEKCYAFNDIKNGRLSFGAPKLFNDPMDPLIRVWAKSRLKHPDDFDDAMLALSEPNDNLMTRIRNTFKFLRDRFTPKQKVLTAPTDNGDQR